MDQQWYSAPEPGNARVAAWVWVLLAVVLLSSLATATFTLGSFVRDWNAPAAEPSTGP